MNKNSTPQGQHTPTLRARSAEWLGDHSPRYEAKIFDGDGVFYSLVVAFSEDEANERAAFIVRAVEAFDAMQKALLAVHQDIDLANVKGGSTELMQIVSEALSRAEGEARG